MYVAGSNLFGQWFLDDYFFEQFQVVSKICVTSNFNLNKAQLVWMCWSYNIFKLNKTFYLSGSWQGKENKLIKLSIPDECELDSNLVLVGNDYNLIILDKKLLTMWIMDFKLVNSIRKINLVTEYPVMEKGVKKCRKDAAIVKVIATNNSCVNLTDEGNVYIGMLPSYVDTSNCIGKVCDVVCGYEHYVLLTDAGRVYTWGNGRRLQLGHGDVLNMDTPTAVEALAGIKIIKISAGGWHTLALSEFGDLYGWGWNDTGQLGIRSKEDTNEAATLASFSLPTLVDIYDEDGKEVDLDVIDMDCGSRHSAILLEDNTVWTSGNNKYGQLGLLSKDYPTISSYKKTFQCDKNNFKLRCGPWCTVLDDQSVN